jgi:predicted lipoprotein
MAAEASVQQLEIATGLKELLQNSGFFTVKSILNSSADDIAKALRIEAHVAKIIVDEAGRLLALTEIAVYNNDNHMIQGDKTNY